MRRARSRPARRARTLSRPGRMAAPRRTRSRPTRTRATSLPTWRAGTGVRSRPHRCAWRSSRPSNRARCPIACTCRRWSTRPAPRPGKRRGTPHWERPTGPARLRSRWVTCAPRTKIGNPSTPADEADVMLDASITDVHRIDMTTDYLGTLEAVTQLRITDKLSGTSAADPGSMLDYPLELRMPCTPVAGTPGSTCAAVTSADALVPGLVTEGKRAVWQLGQVDVYRRRLGRRSGYRREHPVRHAGPVRSLIAQAVATRLRTCSPWRFTNDGPTPRTLASSSSDPASAPRSTRACCCAPRCRPACRHWRAGAIASGWPAAAHRPGRGQRLGRTLRRVLGGVSDAGSGSADRSRDRRRRSNARAARLPRESPKWSSSGRRRHCPEDEMNASTAR